MFVWVCASEWMVMVRVWVWVDLGWTEVGWCGGVHKQRDYSCYSQSYDHCARQNRMNTYHRLLHSWFDDARSCVDDRR
jgi:hypothetical protein